MDGFGWMDVKYYLLLTTLLSYSLCPYNPTLHLPGNQVIRIPGIQCSPVAMTIIVTDSYYSNSDSG